LLRNDIYIFNRRIVKKICSAEALLQGTVSSNRSNCSTSQKDFDQLAPWVRIFQQVVVMNQRSIAAVASLLAVYTDDLNLFPDTLSS
jgi:hypothetical protein